MDISAELAAQQLIRALRGARSQEAASRRLGFRSNVLADWERGRRAPSLSRLPIIVDRLGRGFATSLAEFDPDSPTAFAQGGIEGWLRQLKGTRSAADIARTCGRSEHQVGRWLRGTTAPRLPDALRLIDTLTGRVADFVAALVPIESVPSLADRHRAQRTAINVVLEQPYAAAVLTAAEAGLDPHVLGEPEEVQPAIDALIAAGFLTGGAGDLVARTPMTVSLRPSGADRARLRRAWADLARRRLDNPGEADLFSYNVFALSQTTYARVRELQLAFYREVQGLVAAGSADPADVAALLTMHLIRWGPEPSHRSPTRPVTASGR